MISYLLKRLISMAITLFLITVVVFLIISLSPIDPAQMAIRGGGGKEGADRSAEEKTQGAIQEMREHYNLDMPVALNLDVEDQPKLFERSVATLVQPPKKEDRNKKHVAEKLVKAKKDLRELGSCVFRELSIYLQKNSLPPFEELLPTLAETFYLKDDWKKKDFSQLPDKDLGKFMKSAEELSDFEEKISNLNEISKGQIEQLEEKGKSCKTLFLTWWEKNQKSFEKENIHKWIEDLKKDDPKVNSQAMDQLKSLGRIVVPFLVDFLFKPNSFVRDAEKAEDLRLRAMAVLVKVTDQKWIYEKKSSPQTKEEVLYYWKRWWKRNDKYFITLAGAQKFIRPLTHTQYGTWMGNLLRLDFGRSWLHKRPVMEVIVEKIPISLQIALPSFILAYLMAIPLGVFSATHRNSRWDKALTVALFILYSLPSFWIAILLIQTLTSGPLGFFPTSGLTSTGYETMSWPQQIWDRMQHLFLPLFCMTYGSLAYISRQMRASMLESINQDYIRTARAKGLREKVVVWKHVFWNSTIPILTLLSGIFPVLMGGSVIIEYIFSIPGMGVLSYEAIMQNDKPMVMAVMFFYAVLTLVGILVVDIMYAFVDPRITYD